MGQSSNSALIASIVCPIGSAFFWTKSTFKKSVDGFGYNDASINLSTGWRPDVELKKLSSSTYKIEPTGAEVKAEVSKLKTEVVLMIIIAVSGTSLVAYKIGTEKEVKFVLFENTDKPPPITLIPPTKGSYFVRATEIIPESGRFPSAYL